MGEVSPVIKQNEKAVADEEEEEEEKEKDKESAKTNNRGAHFMSSHCMLSSL